MGDGGEKAWEFWQENGEKRAKKGDGVEMEIETVGGDEVEM